MRIEKYQIFSLGLCFQSPWLKYKQVSDGLLHVLEGFGDINDDDIWYPYMIQEIFEDDID